MKMSEYRPRVPEANRCNVVEYCAAYMSTYGGDIRNAYKCWLYDIWEEGHGELRKQQKLRSVQDVGEWLFK